MFCVREKEGAKSYEISAPPNPAPAMLSFGHFRLTSIIFTLPYQYIMSRWYFVGQYLVKGLIPYSFGGRKPYSSPEALEKWLQLPITCQGMSGFLYEYGVPVRQRLN